MSTTPASASDSATLAQPAALTAAAASSVAAASSRSDRQPDAAGTAPPDDEEAELEDEPQHLTHFILFNALPSAVVSGVVHFIAFIVLALLTLSPPQKSETLAINAAPPSEKNDEQLHEEKFNLALDSALPEASESVTEVLQNVVQSTDTPTVAMDVDAAPIHVELSDFGEKTAPKNDLMATIGATVGSGVAGRGAAERGVMVAKVGGSPESEAAVAAALKWLSEHQ